MSQSLAEIYAAELAAGRLQPDPDQERVVALLDGVRAELDAPQPRGLRGLFARAGEPPKGVYLWGGVGRGKSMLMDLFVTSVRAPARRVHFHAFMQEVQAGLHEARQSGVDDALKPVALALARGLRLLAFDEMQITDITDAMIVGRLFEILLAEGVTIVTTSNRPPDDLYKDGLNRGLFLPFIQLLKDRLTVCELVSPHDYRQNRLAGEQVYFTPANAAARRAIDAIWHDLAHGNSVPLVLNVKGRQVTLPDSHNGMARAGFWDLCGRPLGPADYLAIAGAVRLLVIEDVPQLSSENFNQARRFVTLIDTLYEARVRVIISAADEPERLYVEGEGAFEFARTASRLREMQAAGWGAEATLP